MKTLKLTVIMLFMTMGAAFAQGDAAQQEQVTLNCDFKAGDVALIYQSLVTVDIKGSEVPAFIDVQNTLKPHVQKMLDNKTTVDADVKIDLPLGTANNLFIFLNRLTIKGGEAEKVARFKASITTAAKAAQAATQK